MANQPGSPSVPVSQLTGQLSGLGIGRGENHAQTAPRTARVEASGAFETPFHLHGYGYHNASYDGSSAWRMDAQPPGDIPVFEAPNSPLDAGVTSHHSSPPNVDATTPILRQASGSGTRGGIMIDFGRSIGLIGSSSNPTTPPPIDDAQPGVVAQAQVDAAAQLPAHYAEIMGVLPDYERGVAFPILEDRVGTLQLKSYLSSKGGLKARGETFRSMLNTADRARLDRAIAGRRAALADASAAALAQRQYLLSRRPAHYDDIMDETFLTDLARGVRITELDKLSGGSFARGYFKSDGTLLASATIFRSHLNDADQARFDRACATRQATMQAFRRIGLPGFSKIARFLATGGITLDDAAAQAGVAADDARIFVTEEGLTPAGNALLRDAGTAASRLIVGDLDHWQQHPAGQAALVQPEQASPAASFFDFIAPGHHSPVAGTGTDWQDYEQEALWRSLADHPAPGQHVGPATEQAPFSEAPAAGNQQRSRRRTARAVTSAGRQLPAHYAEIMALLPDLGRGTAIPILQLRVGNAFDVGVYFRPDGGLNPHGEALRRQLGETDRAILDATLVARQAALADENIAALAKEEHYMLRPPAHYDDIMGGDFLDDFARGTKLTALDNPDKKFTTRAYFKSDGTLTKGGVIFRNHLARADKLRFDRACADRSAIAQAYRRIGRDGFRKVAQALAAGGRTLDAAASHASVSASDLRLFLTDDGMTPAGEVCLDKSDALIWAPILQNLERWQQQRQPQRQRTPAHAEYASPAGSFFDFAPPGPQQGDAAPSPRDYEQESLWNALVPQHPAHYAEPHAAGPSSSTQPPSASDWEANMAAQAARLGIPFFGIDDVGPEWRGSSFVDHHGQPFAYAPDRLAGRLAALLHAGEIDSGDLVSIRGVNHRILPIGGHPMPTLENPHGTLFALYPI